MSAGWPTISRRCTRAWWRGRTAKIPRIVLLTTGPAGEGYFAHAYLARYLGYTLAEGGDLTTRDNRVYLKSVDGLKPVDLILRRVDAEDCDPLELRADSLLGVAGLVQAIRAGNVTVANALGSGLAETKAMLAFLPNLCRRLLGEDLKIPSTSTWWCGDEQVKEFVLDNLDRLAIDSAFKRRTLLSRTTSAVPGASLTPEERLQIIDQIATRGNEFVGQELVSLSTTPMWTADGLAAASDDAARLCRRHQGRRLHGDAGRADPGFVVAGRPRDCAASRRGHQGHLDPRR